MTKAITVQLPHDAAAVARMQRQAEDDAGAIASIQVDASTYDLADALLTDVVQRKDAAIKMRKSATGPMYDAIRVVESWFRPLVGALESAEKHLKSGIGVYRVAIEAREREARELAAVAAETQDAPALLEALTVASEPAPTGRATASFRWAVKRVVEDLLPDEYWCVDTAKIDAVARAEKGDSPPVIPGVIFERIADVRARR